MKSDITGTEGAAILCTGYTLNGYKDRLLLPGGVFQMIKDDGDYSGYNLKLTEQYWCSDTVSWQRTHTWTKYESWDISFVPS
ncbi:MAG: hypothetical protein LBD86_02670 [Spirochaetaceae bacterium]|nr:hypothetical protein [Spirochaetaceae bacterium]